ncbi:hypothetical protein AgCh_030307 [Apium graveolens]
MTSAKFDESACGGSPSGGDSVLGRCRIYPEILSTEKPVNVDGSLFGLYVRINGANPRYGVPPGLIDMMPCGSPKGKDTSIERMVNDFEECDFDLEEDVVEKIVELVHFCCENDVVGFDVRVFFFEFADEVSAFVDEDVKESVEDRGWEGGWGGGGRWGGEDGFGSENCEG